MTVIILVSLVIYIVPCVLLYWSFSQFVRYQFALFHIICTLFGHLQLQHGAHKIGTLFLQVFKCVPAVMLFVIIVRPPTSDTACASDTAS